MENIQFATVSVDLDISEAMRKMGIYQPSRRWGAGIIGETLPIAGTTTQSKAVKLLPNGVAVSFLLVRTLA